MSVVKAHRAIYGPFLGSLHKSLSETGENTLTTWEIRREVFFFKKYHSTRLFQRVIKQNKITTPGDNKTSLDAISEIRMIILFADDKDALCASC